MNDEPGVNVADAPDPTDPAVDPSSSAVDPTSMEAQLDHIRDLLERSGPSALLFLLGLFAVLLLLTLPTVRFLLLRMKPLKLEPPAWNGLDVAFGFALWFGLQISTGLFGEALVRLASIEEPKAAVVRLSFGMLGSALAFGAMFMIPMVRYRQGPRSLGLERARVLPSLWMAALIYVVSIWALIAMTVAWLFALVYMGFSPTQQRVVELFRESIQSGDYSIVYVLALHASVLAPLVEELLFRGLLFRWLEAKIGVRPGILISGLVFGAVHMNLMAFPSITLLGCLLAALYHRTGNLWAAIFLHAIFNSVMLGAQILSASA